MYVSDITVLCNKITTSHKRNWVSVIISSPYYLNVSTSDAYTVFVNDWLTRMKEIDWGNEN